MSRLGSAAVLVDQATQDVDAFHRPVAAAIAAVAVAAAAKHYQPGIAQADHMSDSHHRDFLAWHERTTLENYVRRTTEARAAVAQATPYSPSLATYYEDASAVGDRPNEVIAALRAARESWYREHRTRQVGPRQAVE